MPPLTPMVPVYGVPTVPDAGGVRTSVMVPGSMVRLTGPVTVRVGLDISATLTVRFTVPATVGVPLTRQLAPSVSPACNVPEVIVQL